MQRFQIVADNYPNRKSCHDLILIFINLSWEFRKGRRSNILIVLIVAHFQLFIVNLFQAGLCIVPSEYFVSSSVLGMPIFVSSHWRLLFVYNFIGSHRNAMIAGVIIPLYLSRYWSSQKHWVQPDEWVRSDYWSGCSKLPT